MNNTIYIKSSGVYHSVNYSDILWVNSSGNYSTFHLSDKEFTVKMSLNKIKSQIPINEFAQIHKQFIINVEQIASIDLTQNFVIINSERLPIGRTYKTSLLEKLQFMG